MTANIHKSLSTSWQKIKSPTLKIYPIIIIISIPLLLLINTYWNLKSFNRDANFLVRHQAVSIAESIESIIRENIDNKEQLIEMLSQVKQSNEDIREIMILQEVDSEFYVYASDSQKDNEKFHSDLIKLSQSFDESFAGLVYEPSLQRNIWNVSVPVDNENNLSIFIKIDVESVSKILQRTAKDSYLVLVALVIITVILLLNHFIFYQKSLKTQQLEELDKLKDEFISMAAHELRAPITAVIGYMELIQQKISPEEAEKIKSDFETLNVVTKELNNLINELLDVSRIEQGRIKVNKQPVNINQVIEKIITLVRPTVDKKGLELLFKPEEIPTISSDPERIRQIIMNLVSNAIKYTPKGNITIRTRVKGSGVEIQVKDTGVGIPGDEIKNLFSKFHRIKDENTRDATGTGLGLWITKQLVELLGGKIIVESIYGTGSSFTITFPIDRSV